MIRGHQSRAQIHFRSHLREFPDLAPFDPAVAVLAPRQLVDNELAKVFAFPSQHELFRERLSSLEKAELRIGDNANAFERHQGTHNIREVCRQAERIFVHHFREIIGQLFEIHFAEFEIQVVLKQPFDYRPYSLRIDSRFQEIQVDNVLSQTMHVFANYMKEGINHLRLQLRHDATDHAEIEERQMATVHY